jgi:hypothetical protein
MDERELGQILVFHSSWLLLDLALNFGFLIVCYLSRWPLLRFQWAHALGMAVVFWLVMVLSLVQNDLKRTDDVASQRTAQSRSQQ